MDRKSRRKAARANKPAEPPKHVPPPVPPVIPPQPVELDTSDDPLTPRERMFVEEYIADPNATQAYRRAFKCKSYVAARTGGCLLLTNPNIQSELASARKMQSSRTRITADRTLREIARLAFSDTRDLLDDDDRLLPISKVPIHTRRAIQSVKVKKTKLFVAKEQIGEEEVVEVKMASKDAALGRLMKHLGLTKEITPLDILLASLPPRVRDAIVATIESDAAAGRTAEVDDEDDGGGEGS